MDIRQFNKNRGGTNNKPTGCIPRVPKTHQNGMKTFSGNFSKSEPSRNNPSNFGIWNDQSSSMPSRGGKEKVHLNRKQEQKRRIAIEAIKLAEQRKRAMMERNNSENEIPAVSKEKFGDFETRRVLFSLDVNQAPKGKSMLLTNKVPKLPSIKETEVVDAPKGRPILKRNFFRETKQNQPPSELMKKLSLDESVKRVTRYSIAELKDMNPLKEHSKLKRV